MTGLSICGALRLKWHPQRDEQSEIMLGLGQWVIWPFLLAYALALRITKMTVDVFEWAM
jgi:hypothetical protein